MVWVEYTLTRSHTHTHTHIIIPRACARGKAIGFIVVIHTKINRSWFLGVPTSGQCCQDAKMAKNWAIFASKCLIRSTNTTDRAFDQKHLLITPTQANLLCIVWLRMLKLSIGNCRQVINYSVYRVQQCTLPDCSMQLHAHSAHGVGALESSSLNV